MTQLKQIVYVPRENGGYFILAINDGGILFRGTPKNAPGGKLVMKWEHVEDAVD